MASAYESSVDTFKQPDKIHTLAERYHVSEEIVQQVYQEEYEALRSDARVHAFLAILVERHINERLIEIS